MRGIILEPVDIINFEFVQDGNSCVAFISVEFYKLLHFLVENLLVLAGTKEVLRHDVVNVFCQEIGDLAVG